MTYIRVGDYYIPNLALDPEPAQPIRDNGKYVISNHYQPLFGNLQTGFLCIDRNPA